VDEALGTADTHEAVADADTEKYCSGTVAAGKYRSGSVAANAGFAGDVDADGHRVSALARPA